MNGNVEMNEQGYKCAICGKVYKTVEERARCEMRCIAEAKNKEKAAAEAEKNKAGEAITKQFMELRKSVQTYNKKYGEAVVIDSTDLTGDNSLHFIKYDDDCFNPFNSLMRDLGISRGILRF